MQTEDIRRIRLYRQHLTAPAETETVVKDLCGIQAQIPSNVPHALTIRTGKPADPETYGEGLVKNWTIRGTIHEFHKDDLPLFLPDPALYRKRDWHGYGVDAAVLTRERQDLLADRILEKVAEGVTGREELKADCFSYGMTGAEADCMFESWGGGMRDLCARSFLCYRAGGGREFMQCPDFVPMGVDMAERELMRRYLTHYGPVTLRDMAYYFGWNQTKCRNIMASMTDTEIYSAKTEGREYFWAGELPQNAPEVPDCLFLAGFDPLMLGYEKKDGFFIPAESLRGIFTLQGIVMPALLLDGLAAARWKVTGRKLTVTCFRPLTEREQQTVSDQAAELFPKVSKIAFV